VRQGTFVAAAAAAFPDAELILGIDINPSHLRSAEPIRLSGTAVGRSRIEFPQGDWIYQWLG
jgi:hypothetical protein